jgi:hypothetical protein
LSPAQNAEDGSEDLIRPEGFIDAEVELGALVLEPASTTLRQLGRLRLLHERTTSR